MKMRRTRWVLREGRMEARVTGSAEGVKRGWESAFSRVEEEGRVSVGGLEGIVVEISCVCSMVGGKVSCKWVEYVS